MKQRLKDLWKEGAHICLLPGSTGELAKVSVALESITHTQVGDCRRRKALPGQLGHI